MPAKFEVTLEKVMQEFTPEVVGAFWISEQPFSSELPGFHELNYLFDGLISQYLFGLEEKVAKRSHIFFTNNFNQKIFLSHIQMDSEINSALDEQIALIQENSGVRKKILIINLTNVDWKERLEKRYSKFLFQNLEL